MKSGQLTSLSATAYHSDVLGVRLRAKRRPPPRICPLLIRPHPCWGDAGLRRRFSDAGTGFAKGSSVLLVAQLRYFVVG
jgi:hypothetical protein